MEDSVRDSITGQLRAKTVLQLHQVADLMLEIYQTLARMQYLDEEGIEKGPHDITNLLPEYGERGVHPSIIYLYSILPYVKPPVSEDFWQHGEFADFRCAHKMEESRDPLWSEGEEDERIASHMTPLSFVGGGHATAIIYSARIHAIWMFGQGDSGSSDPMLQSGDYRLSLQGQGEHGIFSNLQGRPAADVLRYINDSYKSLENVPGGGPCTPGEWKEDIVRPLYEKHGWLTGNFNAEGFLVDQARENARIEVRYFLDKRENNVKRISRLVAEKGEEKWQKLQAKIDSASSAEEGWNARWKLLETRKLHASLLQDLERAQEDVKVNSHFKQEEMLVWEEDWLQYEVQQKREELASKEKKAAAKREAAEKEGPKYEGAKDEDCDDKPAVEDEDEDENGDLWIRRYRKMLAIYEKAHQETKRDAEKAFPKTSLQQICGGAIVEWSASNESRAKELEDRRELNKKELKSVEEFLKLLPDEIEEVRDAVHQVIKSCKDFLEYAERTINALRSKTPE